MDDPDPDKRSDEEELEIDENAEIHMLEKLDFNDGVEIDLDLGEDK